MLFAATGKLHGRNVVVLRSFKESIMLGQERMRCQYAQDERVYKLDTHGVK